MLRRSYALTSIAFALSTLGATDAAAAAKRTFVASYGLPANIAFNCSIANPCRQFSEAIGVTTSGGEVIVLDSAGYGPVTITKSVTIAAAPGVYAGISVSSGDGVTVNAGASASVVLRGLALNNQGGANGIVIQNTKATYVEACVISGFDKGILYNVTPLGSYLIVAETVLRGNDRGIEATGPSPYGWLEVVRSRFHDNASAGLLLQDVRHASVADSYFGTNYDGIAIKNTGAATASTSLAIERTAILDSFSDGLFAFDPGAHFAVVNVANSTIAGNVTGVGASLHGFIRISGTQINGNNTGVVTSGTGGIVTLGTNMLYGNGVNGAFTGSLSPN